MTTTTPRIPELPDTPPPEDQVAEKVTLENARQLSLEVAGLKSETMARLADDLGYWLTAKYVVTAKDQARKFPEGRMDLKTLDQLIASVGTLRRGDHSAAWIGIWRDRLDFDCMKDQRDTLEKFAEWSADEKVKAALASGASHTVMIESLGRAIYGEDWDE